MAESDVAGGVKNTTASFDTTDTPDGGSTTVALYAMYCGAVELTLRTAEPVELVVAVTVVGDGTVPPAARATLESSTCWPTIGFPFASTREASIVATSQLVGAFFEVHGCI